MIETILKGLDKEKEVISYRKDWNRFTGSITATILLRQVFYWYKKNNFEPFYKFKTECTHRLYNSEKRDDWCSELGFTRKEFDTALNKIGFKFTGKTKDEKHDKFVEYWTDGDRITYYKINMYNFLLAISELYLKYKSGFSKIDLAKVQKGLYVKYKSDFSKSTNRDLRKVQKGLYIYTKTTQRLPTKTTNNKGRGVSSETSQIDEKKKKEPTKKLTPKRKKVAPKKEKEPSLHTLAKDRFNHWHGIFAPDAPPIYWDGKEIGQLTQMLNRLKDAAKKKNFTWSNDQEFIESIFDVFCERFIKSDQWYADSFTPSGIVSKWNLIIQSIGKNGSKKGNSTNVTDSFRQRIYATLNS